MRFIPILLVAVLVGCAQQSPATTAPPSEAPSMDPTPTSEPSIHVSLAPSTDRPETDGAELTGTLGADDIEGGCAYLEADDGTRYEVIYPDGWQVSAAPLELRDPEGEVVATGGDTVTVSGHEAADMVSICQIGPMFMADEVVSVD
jgi:hypothetical protein